MSWTSTSFELPTREAVDKLLGIFKPTFRDCLKKVKEQKAMNAFKGQVSKYNRYKTPRSKKKLVHITIVDRRFLISEDIQK